MEAADRYFAAAHIHRPTVTEMAEFYRSRKMMAVVFTVDCTTTMGVPPVPNDEIAQAAIDNPDALIAFGSVDPHLGRQAVNEVHRLVDEYDAKGFKFHPNTQAFFPNDPEVYPIYEAIAEHNRIALFHTGQTGIGAGVPGGGGIKTEVLQPDVRRRRFGRFPRAQDHSRPPIVPVAGRGVVRRHPQTRRVHRPVGLVTKVLSGQPGSIRQHDPAGQGPVRSDFPLITPDRWIADFETLEIKDSVRPKIMKHDAARLLGLT